MVMIIFKLYLSSLNEELSIKIQENIQIMKLKYLIFLILNNTCSYGLKYNSICKSLIKADLMVTLLTI